MDTSIQKQKWNFPPAFIRFLLNSNETATEIVNYSCHEYSDSTIQHVDSYETALIQPAASNEKTMDD